MEHRPKTLSDKIAGMLNTAPSTFDPEDDDIDLIKAPNVDLLELAEDEKYAGKKMSRKDFAESDSDGNSITSKDDSDNLSEIGSGQSEDEEEDAENSDYASSDSEDDSNDGESNTDIDEEESANKKDVNFKHFNEGNKSNQMKKGHCVRNQMAIWENLLEIRIQLQKCLFAANKMPSKDHFAEVKCAAGSDFTNKVNETKENVSSVLEKLSLLQQLMLAQFPETKKLTGNKTTDGDEEIPSEDDEEEEITGPPLKKIKLEEYEKKASKLHKKYRNYRNKVIQKWNDKTQVVAKGEASHSVLDQIEYSLRNKNKLLKETQLKKPEYIIGEDVDENKGVEHDSEIFDDKDFYHQLLRELIEAKSSDMTNPVQLGRQWIHLQNLRNKIKRKIDTKATKGRKIRYVVHSKLLNFMAPFEENSWTDEAKNELYNTLFV